MDVPALLLQHGNSTPEKAQKRRTCLREKQPPPAAAQPLFTLPLIAASASTRRWGSIDQFGVHRR
jgi:hypothetical protein